MPAKAGTQKFLIPRFRVALGLQLTGVRPGADGVEVRVEAADAVLTAQAE